MSPYQRKPRSSVSQPPLTIREVAQRAGVSTATVSRVLSGQMVVSEELTDRVQSAVQELGYRPNRVTRRNRKLPNQVVGLVAPDLQSPYYNGMIAEMTAVLEEAGYSLVIYDSGNDPQREVIHLNTLRAAGAAGIILATTNSEWDEMSAFLRTGPPLVALDHKLDYGKADCVRVDHAALAQAAVEQLLTGGRQRIALVDEPQRVSAARERREGYTRALEAAQAAQSADWVLPVEDIRGLLALQPAPDAILAGSLQIALDLLCALGETSLRPAEDVVVGSFEPLPGCLGAYAPVQVFAPPAGIGRAAAEMLLERIARPRMLARDVVL